MIGSIDFSVNDHLIQVTDDTLIMLFIDGDVTKEPVELEIDDLRQIIKIAEEHFQQEVKR